MDRGEAGSLGGKETLRRYGTQHFRELGRKGFETTVARHWNGDCQGFREYLANRRWERQTASFADSEIQRRLEAGEKIASVELPVMADPDEEPSFREAGWRDQVKGSRQEDEPELPF